MANLSTNIRLLQAIAPFVLTTTVQRNGDLYDYITTFLLAAGGAPIDLTGITFRAMVRPALGDPRIALDAQTVDWASGDVPAGNGYIVSGGTLGTLNWAIPQAVVAGIPTVSLDANAPSQTLALDMIAWGDGFRVPVASNQSTFTVTMGVTEWFPMV